MPSKTEEYLALAQRTANGLTRYWESWTAYLTTASRLYKYRFEDQLMIYSQRPDATACADYDIWNNRMNRYVRRGSKGIALLDESSGYPRLHYVFDVSDTGVRRNSRDPDLWQYNDDLKQPVSDALTAAYGISHERFSQQLADIAGKLVADYWDNNSEDIRAIVDGSFLMDYDSTGLEMQFKSAAAISVTYTLLERCGFEPDGFFDKDSFQAIYDFSTPDTVYALGAAVSDISREVLRTVERAVKTTIRRRNNERSQHEHEQQSELHADRGLSSPEPDPASAEDPAGQVRQDAPELPEAAAPGAVPHDAPEREPVPDPEQTGADRSGNEGPDDGRTAGEEPGSGQGEEPDGVGAAHEQSAGAGRGSDSDGTDLQLSFLDAVIPTETQQIEHIDRAESEKSPSAFALSQAEIENELREHGSGVQDGKWRIIELYQTQPDRKLRAKALAKEYGIGGHSQDFLDGSSGFVNHDGKGLEFDRYPDHQKFTLSWTQVEKYIDLMIQSDRYLTDQEKEHRAAVQEAERQLPMLEGDAAAEYNALKEQYPNTLIGFELGGYFLFYDKDAFAVKEVLRSNLLSQENALGKVKVTGFLRGEWVAKSQKLWAEGNSIYLAGQSEDGTHHQTKHLRKEDYLPIGSIIKLDGRDFRVDHVNFMFKSVSLQDMDLTNSGQPIFRVERLPHIRELYEQQQDEIVDVPPEKAIDYKVGDEVVVDLHTRTIEGKIGYVGETDVRIDTSAHGQSWDNEVLNKRQFEDGLRRDEPTPDEELNKLPISTEVNREWQTFPNAAAANEALNAEPVPEAAGNFHITDDNLGIGGPKQKFARNIEAIQTLRTLEQEHRGATAEEQQVLSQYVGWGGLADVFDPNKENWSAEYESAEFLDRWVQTVRKGIPMVVPDAEATKEAYPAEYNLYQRLGIRSVIAVSLEPRPVALLAVRNPKRYIQQTSMLRILAYVLLASYNEQKMLNRLQMAYIPTSIQSSKDIYVSLFGELSISTSKGVLKEADFSSPRISRLISYLLISRKNAISPQEITQTLWPDDSDNPAKNVKGLVYRLRQKFSLISDEPLILSSASGYQLNPELHIMTDYQRFDELVSSAARASSVINKVDILKNALDLYRGKVLSSADGEHWLIQFSTKYHLSYMGAVSELLKQLDSLHSYDLLNQYAMKSLTIAPDNPKAYCWLIRSLKAQGMNELATNELAAAKEHLTTEEYEEILAFGANW